MNWCTRDAGSFLLYIVNILRSELRSLTALPPDLRQVGVVKMRYTFECLCVCSGVTVRAGTMLLLSVWLSTQEES